MKKLFTYTLLSLGAIAILTVGIVSAASANQEPGNFPPLIQKIIDKFNLNPSEVQTLMDENRAEHQQQMQAKMAERKDQTLTKAVESGKITEAQRQAILAKQADMQTKMQELKGLPKEEQTAKMRELKQEIEAWAEANSIPANFAGLCGLGVNMGFRGKGPHFFQPNQQ